MTRTRVQLTQEYKRQPKAIRFDEWLIEQLNAADARAAEPYRTEEIEYLWSLLCSRPETQIIALELGIAKFETMIRTIEKLAWGVK